MAVVEVFPPKPPATSTIPLESLESRVEAAPLRQTVLRSATRVQVSAAES